MKNIEYIIQNEKITHRERERESERERVSENRET